MKLSTGRSERGVFLRVEDSGAGISPEVLQKVFVPFFTTKDVGEGTGLGLPVVHGIVASHEGSIDIQSEIGKGTRVEVLLPMTPADPTKGHAV